MQKNIFALFSALLVLILSVSFIPLELDSKNLKTNQPKTVPYVDVNLYLGTWYEQAVIPYYFERECTQTTATYSLRSDGKIKVDNKCVRNGKEVGNIGKAIPEDSTNSKLKVQFIETLDIGGQYWIVRLAGDYSYSVVSSPDYRYLWIMYRKPIMPEVIYNEIIYDLKKDGFPVEKLRRTQQ